jgi:hypothetical protein
MLWNPLFLTVPPSQFVRPGQLSKSLLAICSQWIQVTILNQLSRLTVLFLWILAFPAVSSRSPFCSSCLVFRQDCSRVVEREWDQYITIGPLCIKPDLVNSSPSRPISFRLLMIFFSCQRYHRGDDGTAFSSVSKSFIRIHNCFHT